MGYTHAHRRYKLPVLMSFHWVRPSGQWYRAEPFLRLWYHRREEFNLERMFPDRSEMALLNDLLDKCIVEDEKDCLKNAGLLLKEIDSLLGALRFDADPMSDSERPCRVCGFGKYQLTVDNRDRYTAALKYYGLNVPSLQIHGVPTFKIFVCNNCGTRIQTLSTANTRVWILRDGQGSTK